jgi:hypothetical protein
MLFSNDAEVNRSKLYGYFERFCRSCGFPHGSIEVSGKRMDALSIALSENMEIKQKMSPFKIAGVFSVECIRHSPVVNKFPHEKLARFNPNSVFAYFYSVDGLVNARIEPKGIFMRIPRRIMVSEHFLSEFTFALTKCRTREDAALCALIYESLCYQFNEGHYERVL